MNYVLFSCQSSINQCLISCSNMIWTFRIFCTLLFALCVQAHVAAHKVKNHPPTGSRVLAEKAHPKKVSENNKKGKYLLGLGFLLNDVNIFPKRLFGI